MTTVSEAGAIHLQVTPDIFMLTLSEDGLDSTLRCDVYDIILKTMGNQFRTITHFALKKETLIITNGCT